MYLLDSNIIIYCANSKEENLRNFILNNNCYISAVSKIEVLGYHKITKKQIEYFESLFSIFNILPIDDKIVEISIKLRQKNNITLGDVLIAATAKKNNLILATRNIKDFKNIRDISLINPIEIKE